MFNKNLGACPLTDNDSNEFFTNIIGVHCWDFRGDYSLLALTRALLYSRINADETVRVHIGSMNFRIGVFGGSNTHEQIINSVFARMGDYNCIEVISADSDVTANNAFFDVIDNADHGFVNTFKTYGFHEEKDLREFAENSRIKARFYFSETFKTTAVVVDRMDFRSYHFIASLVPRFVKCWLDDKPLTQEEFALCKSLTGNKPAEYLSLLENFCSKIDFRSHKIRRMLGGYEARVRERNIEEAQSTIEGIRADIERNNERYRKLIVELDDANIRLNGLMHSDSDENEESELIQFITRSKFIDLISCDRTIDVIIRSYLDVFDPDMFKTLTKRERSYMLSIDGTHETNKVFRNVSVRKKFLSAIFSDEPILRIKTCAYFRIDPNGDAVGVRGYGYPNEYRDMMPNPHIQYYACLGQNAATMRDRLLHCDITGCLMQCIASTKCLNLSDSTVITRFVNDLFNSTNKIIELPDKSSVTVLEAYNWLIAQEEGNNHNENQEEGDRQEEQQETPLF